MDPINAPPIILPMTIPLISPPEIEADVMDEPAVEVSRADTRESDVTVTVASV
jgi:hypothetical protein